MNMQNDFRIRRAHEEEAGALSELALRSKSYWPYDAEYLELCRATTRMTSEEILQWPVLVATLGEQVCGVTMICEVKGERMLEHLWIDPPWIGRGVGRLLFQEALRHAAKLGWKDFRIFADPYAEKFYLKLGAVRIGERESKVRPGFFLPLLEYSLNRS